jgi:hypothetical protein
MVVAANIQSPEDLRLFLTLTGNLDQNRGSKRKFEDFK